MNKVSPAKKVSEKLARVIANSLSVSELKCYNLAEKADSLSFDALYLWVLKNQFGFSVKDLTELFKSVSKEAFQFKDYALSGQYIPPVDELKNFGIDLESLSKEENLWQ